MNHKMTFAKRTIMAFFAIIAAICFCTAIRIAATSADGRVSLLLEGDGTGYFYNENEIVLGENDSAAISFSVKNYLGRYEEKLGFFFASSDGEKEFSVLFDKTGATYRGFSEEEERDAGAVIADLFREGMYLRATLSDYERSFIVEKRVENDRTYTSVLQLSREERRKELARITGGAEITPVLLQGAEELLAAADRYKAEKCAK